MQLIEFLQIDVPTSSHFIFHIHLPILIYVGCAKEKKGNKTKEQKIGLPRKIYLT
jgi:hypothetical protein